MRKFLLAGLLVAGVSVPATSIADSTPTVYATLAECQAALDDARDYNPIYWAAECRPARHVTGWIFTIKGDKPDNKGPGN